MKYTKLGKSDLTVSRICMGCMGFGDAKNGQHSWTLDEENSRRIIRRGLELGVNFFDTAIGYQGGTSEQYLGRALKDFAKRQDVVVATKFLPRTATEIEAGVSGQEHIQRSVDTSLKNLGMDYVDLYIYHMWDYETPLYDIMDGLNRIAKAVELSLSPEETAYLEEAYVPHRLVGVMAQNTPEASGQPHVWFSGKSR